MGEYDDWAGYMLQTELKNRGLPVTGLVSALRKTLEENDEQLALLGIDALDSDRSRRARLVNELRALYQSTQNQLDDELKKSIDQLKKEYSIKIKVQSDRLEKAKAQYDQMKAELDGLKAKSEKEVQKLTDANTPKTKQLEEDNSSRKRRDDLLRELNSFSRRVYIYEDFAPSARLPTNSAPIQDASSASSSKAVRPAPMIKFPRTPRESTPPEGSMFMPASTLKSSSSVSKTSSNGSTTYQSNAVAERKSSSTSSTFTTSRPIASASTPKATKRSDNSPISRTGAKSVDTSSTIHNKMSTPSKAAYSPPSSLVKHSQVCPSISAKFARTPRKSPPSENRARTVNTALQTSNDTTPLKASASPPLRSLSSTTGAQSTPAKASKLRSSPQPGNEAKAMGNTSMPIRRSPAGNSQASTQPAVDLRANAFNFGPSTINTRTPSSIGRPTPFSSNLSSLSKRFVPTNLDSPTPSERRSQSECRSQSRPQPPDPTTRYRSQTPIPTRRLHPPSISPSFRRSSTSGYSSSSNQTSASHPQPPDPATRYRLQTPGPGSRASSVVSIPRVRKRDEYEKDNKK